MIASNEFWNWEDFTETKRIDIQNNLPEKALQKIALICIVIIFIILPFLMPSIDQSLWKKK